MVKQPTDEEPRADAERLSNSSSPLGGRLPLVDPTQLSTGQRELYERLEGRQLAWAEASGFRAKTAGGRLIGPFNVILFSPGVASGLLDFMDTEEQSTSLDGRLRQIVTLTVGAVWESSYELYAHRAVAAKSGLSPEATDSLAAGDLPDELSDSERIAVRFARQLTSDRRVDARLFAEAEQTFGRQALVDLTLLVGYFQTVCGLLNAFDVPAPSDQIDSANSVEQV